MQIKKVVSAQKEELQTKLSPQERALGEIIFNNGRCQVLTQSASLFELIVADETETRMVEYSLEIESMEDGGEEELNGAVLPRCGKDPVEWDRFAYACLLQIENEIHLLGPKEHLEHKKYTRQNFCLPFVRQFEQHCENCRSNHYRYYDRPKQEVLPGAQRSLIGNRCHFYLHRQIENYQKSQGYGNQLLVC